MTSPLEARRRDELAALSAQRDYRRAAESRRQLATELRSRDFKAIADQLDWAADVAAKAAMAERYWEGPIR